MKRDQNQCRKEFAVDTEIMMLDRNYNCFFITFKMSVLKNVIIWDKLKFVGLVQNCGNFSTKSRFWRSPHVKGGILMSTMEVDAVTLEAGFFEEEVWEAVQDYDGNKAPGPDGFNLNCIQRCWPILKGEILSMVNEFHQYGKLSRGVISSFIVLIPEKDNPIGLGDYRPISLANSVYKILAKLLSRRLRKVLPSVINEVQSAFVSGRQILDGVLIANEVVDAWKKSKKRGIILKLDFEKAYDSLNWEFLWPMMNNLGFGEKWLVWMRNCISSVRVSVLVNGSPTEEFQPQKGLRQGDPLSPFLFIIAAEALNLLLARAVEKGLFRGASVGSNDLRISHLQFADDTIVFCEGENKALWKSVVCSRYGYFGGGWLPTLHNIDGASTVWKDIVLLYSLNQSLGEIYKQNLRLALGNGRRIQFWLDTWMNGRGLNEEFPRLFSLSTENEESLQQISAKRSLGVWQLQFRRRLLAWKEEELQRLYATLESSPELREEFEDSCSWLISKTGKFSVSSLWSWWVVNKGPGLKVPAGVWASLAPPKMQFICWLAWRG
ncbi:uncharacterized protein LOC114285700 [Camellia sinensis]|uniref:uncharacterized protein LOC114285700 n=1 Tax=Camellia sinensis TaxID=4442 RepID=UPI00103610AA|nr:uncharacterized protein LOC114285700 [Camellia sinensis]